MQKRVFVLSKDIEVGLNKGELMAVNAHTGTVYFYEPTSQWIFDLLAQPVEVDALIAKYEMLGGAASQLNTFIEVLAKQGIIEMTNETPAANVEITTVTPPVFLRESVYSMEDTALMSTATASPSVID